MEMGIMLLLLLLSSLGHATLSGELIWRLCLLHEVMDHVGIWSTLGHLQKQGVGFGLA